MHWKYSSLNRREFVSKRKSVQYSTYNKTQINIFIALHLLCIENVHITNYIYAFDRHF